MNLQSFAKITVIAFALALGMTTIISQYAETFAWSISSVSQASSETKLEKEVVADANRPTLGDILEKVNSTEAVTAIERSWKRDYEGYFKTNLSVSSMEVEEIANTLGKLGSQTGKKPALIYVVPSPKQLELVLVIPQRKPIRRSVLTVDREHLRQVVEKFTQTSEDALYPTNTNYLATASQLYQWIIAPLQRDLETNSIDTLVFCMGGGLRSMPLAALYDGQKFLVEKYSIALIPAFNLTDTLHRDIRNSLVLAMGASKFKNLPPLAAVPIELAGILQNLSGSLWPGPWQGKIFLNQDFTLDNLKSQRALHRYGIIHLATHAEFNPGKPGNSYIQFWDTQLGLDQMRQLHWNNPPVDLLVLSACRTAVGDKDAEMGFAGLAAQSGVRSAVASLWNVSDEGTLALMTEFYQQLRIAPIKAEALRQAQIAMIRQQLRLEVGQLRGPMLGTGVQLPPRLAALGNRKFSHPYYWSAFTIVGNPW